MQIILKILYFFGLIKLVWVRDHQKESKVCIAKKDPWNDRTAKVPFGFDTYILEEDGTGYDAGYNTLKLIWKDYDGVTIKKLLTEEEKENV